MIPKKFSAGFTLIELMAVMLIIVILATLGLVSYSQATSAARDGKRRSDMETVRQAMILYRQDLGTYPTGTLSTVLSTLVTANFLSSPAPSDPITTMSYTISGSSTTAFCICADVTDTNKGNNSTTANCSSLTTSGSFYCVKEP